MSKFEKCAMADVPAKVREVMLRMYGSKICATQALRFKNPNGKFVYKPLWLVS